MVPCRVGNYSQIVSCRHETPRCPAALSFRAESRNLPAKSFLSVRNTMVPSRTGNHSRTVSCRHEAQRRHVEWETIRKQFPAGMKHKGIMSDRKPFANSFPSVRSAMAPRRSCHFERSREISRRKVSCRCETQWSQVGQETMREQFPVGMKHKGVMSSGKLFASSFLSA